MSQILGFTISRGVSPNNLAGAFEAEDRALSYFQHLERSSLEIGGTTLHIWGRDSISNCVRILPDGSTLALIGSPHNIVSWQSVQEKLLQAKRDEDFELPWEGRVILLRVTADGDSWTIWNDWLGSMPVYHMESSVSRFASTLEPVTVASAALTPDDFFLPGLVSLLLNGHFISDWTLYKDIKSILPDSVTTWDERGYRTKRLWSVQPSQDRWESLWDDLVDEMHALSHQATADILKQHPRWAMPLSAGLDSRLIAGVAANVGVEVRSYAWGSAENTDVIYSREIAKALGFPWKHIDLPKDFLVKYTRRWFDMFGTAMHFQGMYLMSFLDEIQAEPAAPTITGYIGDVLSGDAIHESIRFQATKRYQANHEWYSDWDPSLLRSTMKRPMHDALEENAANLRKEIDSYPGANHQKLMYLELWSRQRTFINFLSTLKDYWRGVATPFLDRNYARFCFSLPFVVLDDRRLLGDVFRRYYGKLAVIPGTYGSEPYIMTGKYFLRKKIANKIPAALRKPFMKGLEKTSLCVDFEPLQAHGKKSMWPLFEAWDQLSEWFDMKQVESDYQAVMTSTKDVRPLRRLQAVQTIASRLLPPSQVNR